MLNLYKPVGQTPLELINDYKAAFSECSERKMAYAGRLDPLAHGVTIVLEEDECFERDKYHGMDKEYYFDVLLGAATDSYDPLGMIQNEIAPVINDELLTKANQWVLDTKGTFNQEYPVFSAKSIRGKKLLWWALHGRLDEIEIPAIDVEIAEIEKVKQYELDAKELRDLIVNKIELVKSPFRQETIVPAWESFFENNKDVKFSVLRYRSVVSTGTYIRSIANQLGKAIGVPTLALEIYRTRVGEFTIEQSTRLQSDNTSELHSQKSY